MKKTQTSDANIQKNEMIVRCRGGEAAAAVKVVTVVVVPPVAARAAARGEGGRGGGGRQGRVDLGLKGGVMVYLSLKSNNNFEATSRLLCLPENCKLFTNRLG